MFEHDETTLRVRLEVEKQSDSYEQIASLQAVSFITTSNMGVYPEYAVYGCTELIEFNFARAQLAKNSRDSKYGKSEIRIIHKEGSGTTPIKIKKLSVFNDIAIECESDAKVCSLTK